MQVEVNGSIEKAIRIFKKCIEIDGIHREIKLRSVPNHSERVREKQRLAFSRLRKRQRKIQTLEKRYGHAFE
jgi:ribosomal protein S21